MLRRLLLPSACLAFLVCLGTGANATPPRIPFDTELEPVSYSKGVEQTELEFTLKSYIDREEIRVTFIPIGDLTISSEITVKGRATRDKPFTARLQVMIPDNDTSGIRMEVDLGGGHRLMKCTKYFITTGERLITSWRDPALPPIVAPSGSVIQLDESKMPPRPIPLVDSTEVVKSRQPASTHWHLKPVSYSRGVELTELEFFYEDDFNCNEMQVSFVPLKNLTIVGETTFRGPIAKNTPFIARLRVMIPDNDTSGIGIKIDQCGLTGLLSKFFITTGETIITSSRDPASGPSIAPSGSVIEFDEIPMTSRPIPLPDSAAIKERRRRTDSLNVRLQQQLKEDIEAEERRRKQEEMRELEKTPLTDDEVQWIQVGDEMWGRKKGEYKFRPAREVNYPHLQERLEYIIENMAPDSGYEVILDLRDPEDLDYLKSMTIDLRPDEREGFYRCTVTRENLQHIVRRKIYWMAPRHPRPAGPARDGTAPPRNDSLSREKCQAGSPDTT